MEGSEDGLQDFDFEQGLPTESARAASASQSDLSTVNRNSITTPGSAHGASQGATVAQNFARPRKNFRQTVCRHWLRGLCMKGSECGFLHQYDKSRMPVCRFFAKWGECREPDCIYKHTMEDIKECNMYKLGFCPNGLECRYRHNKLPGPPPPVEQHLQRLQHRIFSHNGAQLLLPKYAGADDNGGDPAVAVQDREARSGGNLVGTAQLQPSGGWEHGVQGLPGSSVQHVPGGQAPPDPSRALLLPPGLHRYFVVKSYNEDNLRLSVRRGLWATHRNNEARLNESFHSTDSTVLIFSVNETRHFQGCARMLSPIGGAVSQGAGWKQTNGVANYGNNFQIQWLKPGSNLEVLTRMEGLLSTVNYIRSAIWIEHMDHARDMETQLCQLSFQKTRHLRNPYNENLPVKISRDCQELEPGVGEQLTRLLYMEPDSELMAIAKRYEEKMKEPETGASHRPKMEALGIIPFEESNGEQELDSAETEEEEDVAEEEEVVSRASWARQEGAVHSQMAGTSRGVPRPGLPGSELGQKEGSSLYPPGPHRQIGLAGSLLLRETDYIRASILQTQPSWSTEFPHS